MYTLIYEKAKREFGTKVKRQRDLNDFIKLANEELEKQENEKAQSDT